MTRAAGMSGGSALLFVEHALLSLGEQIEAGLETLFQIVCISRASPSCIKRTWLVIQSGRVKRWINAAS